MVFIPKYICVYSNIHRENLCQASFAAQQYHPECVEGVRVDGFIKAH